MNALLTAFRVVAVVAFPLAGGLAAIGCVFWVREQQCARRADDNHAERRARTDANMPQGHPESLTRMLPIPEHIRFMALVEQLVAEAAE